MTAEVFKLSLPERESQYLLIKTILSSGSFKFTPRISSAGLELPCFYDNSWAIENEPIFLEKINLELEKMILKERISHQAFCGVIRGGVILAHRLAKTFKSPWIARLGFKDDRERQELVAGQLPRGREVIMVDDVETTGQNVIAATQRLREEGLDSRYVLYVMSYQLEMAKENLTRAGLRSLHLFGINELLSVGLKEKMIRTKDALRIYSWQKEQNSKFQQSFVAKPNLP